MKRSEIYTPEKIGSSEFKGYRIFRIPIYQRLFEWEDEQLLGLLGDMKMYFENKNIEENTPYYLGMITVSSSGNGIADLVDGQQRFTTMMLLGIAMRNVCGSEWENFTTKDRLSFIAREDDKTYLQWLIGNYKNSNETASEDIPVSVNLKMQHALKVIEDFLKGLGEGKETYCNNVYRRLTFFVAELPAGYKKSPKKLNKYFEAMNSAGRSLEQHEKIKVELLKNCPDGYDKSDFNNIWNEVERMDKRLLCVDEYGGTVYQIDAEIEKVCQTEKFTDYAVGRQEYQDYSMKIEDILPSEEEPKEQRARKDIGSVIDFQELLILALDFTLNQEFPQDKHKLEDVFKSLLSNSDKIPLFYRNLYLIRLLLDRYVIRVEKEDGRNAYRLRLTDEETITEDERRLIQYQSMLYVSTPAHKWLIPYLNWLENLETNVRKGLTASTLLDKLKEIDNNQIHKESDLKPVDDMAYDNGIERYWFWRLDYYLWERRKEKDEKGTYRFFNVKEQNVVDSYVFRANRSIEHLHPQNQTYNEKWNETDINSFGNLAMISASFNSQQSNKSVEEKFGRIKKQLKSKDLESLKMYKMYLTAGETDSGWTTERKNMHQEEMYQILKESFLS
jgi:hypothetical protein